MNRFLPRDRWLIHLEDTNSQRRLEAIREAQTLGESEVEGPLRRVALHDKHSDVRLAALHVLQGFRSEHTAGTMRRALLDPSVENRTLAAEALADYPDDETVLALTTRANDAHSVADAALRSLSKIATDSAMHHLCARAESWGWPRQLDAITALGETRNPLAVPTLAALLSAEEIPVRAAAVKALGNIGAAAGYGGAGALLVTTLVGSLADDASEVRLNAVEALRHARLWESYPALNASLGDDSLTVRSSADAALSSLQASTHSHMALRALGYRLPRLRVGAIRRLESLADRTTLHALAASLCDEDNAVREAAGIALRRLRWEPAADDFHAALRSDIPRLRAGAIRCLASKKDPAWIPQILDGLHDSAPEVRIAAAKALGDLRADDACPVLCEHVADPDPLFREAAIAALGKLGCRRALPPLRARYKTFGGEPDVQIRQALRAAIDAIEERTEHHAHLPLAAAPPEIEDDDLPISATALPDGR